MGGVDPLPRRRDLGAEDRLLAIANALAVRKPICNPVAIVHEVRDAERVSDAERKPVFDRVPDSNPDAVCDADADPHGHCHSDGVSHANPEFLGDDVSVLVAVDNLVQHAHRHGDADV